MKELIGVDLASGPDITVVNGKPLVRKNEWIALLRKEKGMSYEVLSKKSGVNAFFIEYLEFDNTVNPDWKDVNAGDKM